MVFLETRNLMCYLGESIPLVQAHFLCFDAPIKSIAYFRPIAHTASDCEWFSQCLLLVAPLFRRSSQLIRLWRGRQPFPWRPAIDSTAFIQLTRTARAACQKKRRVVSPIGPTERERPTGRNSIDVGNRSARKPSQLHTRHPRRSHTQKRPLAAPRSWGSDERARASLLFPLTDGERDTHTYTDSKFQSAACLF
jgi:hypothetical protein